MWTQWLQTDEAVRLLREHGLSGEDEQLKRIADFCEGYPVILQKAAKVLIEHHQTDVSAFVSHELFEALMNEVLDSNEPELAINLYLGRGTTKYHKKAYWKLGRKLGGYRHGLGLTSAILRTYERQPYHEWSDSEENGLPSVTHDHALYLADLGELKQAEAILRSPIITEAGNRNRRAVKSMFSFRARLNLCDVVTLQGRLSEAQALADSLIRVYDSEDVYTDGGDIQGKNFTGFAAIGEFVGWYSFTTGFNPYARRAWIRGLSGDVERALNDFRRADDFQTRKFERPNFVQAQAVTSVIAQSKRQGFETTKADFDREMEILSARPQPPLMGQAAMYYGVLLTRLGKLETARKVVDYTQRWAAHPYYRYPALHALASCALSDIDRLRGDYVSAREHLPFPLAWSTETGHKESACWVHHALARLELAEKNLTEAQTAIETGLTIAQTHGFMLYEIDCRVTAGWIAFANEDFNTAYEHAKTALELAADPDCGYVWGHGNALHLLASVYAHPKYEPPDYRADSYPKYAVKLAAGAVRLRERIRDPRAANSRELLAKLQAANANDE